MNASFRDHPAARIAARMLQVVLFAVLGIFLYALAFQLLVGTGVMTADMDGEGYGYLLTQKAVIVWLAAILIALVGTFVRENWRWPLIAAPAYAPALYTVFGVLAG